MKPNKIDRQLERLKRLMIMFPAGKRVWHRACGRRGIIMGYVLHTDGSVAVRVDSGTNGTSTDMPASLSKTKISDGSDGDEWKDGEEGAEIR